MAHLSDTSPEAERVLIEVFRRMSPSSKWRLIGTLYRAGRALHAAGMRYDNPAVTAREITAAWIRTNLGMDLTAWIPDHVRADPMPTLQDFAEVARVLDRLSIPYALGGSMASSLWGISRNTVDADVTVEPFSGRELDLVTALGPDYYISELAIRQALRAKSSFNLINTMTGFKVDVFVRSDSPFEISAMARRIPLDIDGQQVFVLSAEDVILFKLRWYRLGNEVSEQQWNDVVNVMKVRGPKLDRAYLDLWTKDLALDDLLTRALEEATSTEQGRP
jgi:hypothetical protein